MPDTQTKVQTHTFTDDEKKEVRMLEQVVIQSRLQLSDLTMQILALTAKQQEVADEVKAGSTRLMDRIQIAMKVRGLDPSDNTQRFDLDMRELVLKQTTAVAAVQ